MITFFLDSNFFLHCQWLSQLPWREIAGGAEDVLVLVPRVVQEELDKLKHDGKSRRAERARKATSLLREVIEAPQLRLTVRSEGPRVVLSFPPRRLVSVAAAQLDLSRQDDRLIQEALAYRAANPECDVRLLTNDTNAMLTARDCDLPYVHIPEAWLLAPEPDERDKVLSELKRRLDVLERESPELSLRVVGIDGTEVQQVRAEVDTFPALSPESIEELVLEAQSKYPMVQRFEGASVPGRAFDASRSAVQSFRGHHEGPSQKEVDHYKRVKYPRWLEEVRRFCNELPRLLELPSRRITLRFILTNSGVRPAENVVVEVRALGGLQLEPPGDGANQGDKVEGLPPAPKPPSGRYVPSMFETLAVSRDVTATFPALDLMSSLHRPAERDPHAFYWKGGRPRIDEEDWVLTCAELRHQVEPEEFDVAIRIPASSLIAKGAVTFRVTASNLPEPLSVTVPITVSCTERDSLSKARDAIRSWTS